MLRLLLAHFSKLFFLSFSPTLHQELIHLLQRAHKDTVNDIGPLLDTTLWASDEGFVEASLPMVLVAELLDSQTLAATEHSFLLLEQRAERIATLCRSQVRSTKVPKYPAVIQRLAIELTPFLS